MVNTSPSPTRPSSVSRKVSTQSAETMLPRIAVRIGGSIGRSPPGSQLVIFMVRHGSFSRGAGSARGRGRRPPRRASRQACRAPTDAGRIRRRRSAVRERGTGTTCPLVAPGVAHAPQRHAELRPGAGVFRSARSVGAGPPELLRLDGPHPGRLPHPGCRAGAAPPSAIPRVDAASRARAGSSPPAPRPPSRASRERRSDCRRAVRLPSRLRTGPCFRPCSSLPLAARTPRTGGQIDPGGTRTH